MNAVVTLGSTYHSNTFPEKVPQKKSTPFSVYAAGIFRLVTAGFTVFSAITELTSKPVVVVKEETSLSTRIKTVFEKIIAHLRAFLFSVTYNIIHGSLFLASGLCAVTSSLHDLGAYSLGKAADVLNTVENWTYLVGSVLGLCYFTERYREADELPPNATPEQIESARRKKTSAVMGIIGCVGWIVNIALTFIGGLATVAFVIGLLATFTGFIKILYDFFRPSTLTPAPVK